MSLISAVPIGLSTRNAGKTLEIGAYFTGSRFSLSSLEMLGIPGKGQERKGASLRENGCSKARYGREHRPDLPWMSDDTGLFIEALGGRPGADAAIWAGENATQEEITAYTLKQMEGVVNRKARFECCITLLMPDRTVHVFEGALNGRLLEAERGTPRRDMPYSALFVPNGDFRTLAEMWIEYENSISHRGQALAKAVKFLEEYYPT